MRRIALASGVLFVCGLTAFFVFHPKEAEELPMPATAREERASSSELQVEVLPPPDPPPITIDGNSLTPQQRALLSKLGIDTTSITISPALLSCVTEALGEARIAEIGKGSLPGTLELVRVMPCIAKN